MSEIEGEDEIFKQFGNFELDNIFAEFDEKVRLTSLKDFFLQMYEIHNYVSVSRLGIALHCSAITQRLMIFSGND